jgi:hypothetical protein
MNISKAINKTLFFLGAGASYDAKCKLSSHMLEDLRKKISSKDDNIFISSEKEALKFLLSCLEYHGEWRTIETAENFKFVPNIEELALLIRRVKNRENFLPYPITGNWADKLVLLEADFKNAPESTKAGTTLFDSLDRKIKSILLPEWLIPQSYDFLEPLKDFLEKHPLSPFRLDIFSLNNDLVLENYFNSNKNKPWRGFASGEWVGFDEEDFPEEFGRINLYKLHGSLDWVRLDTGDFKEIDKLEDADNTHVEEQHSPYVIFGQGTKTFSVEPFFSLVQHFRKKLTNKEYIFVIGYSFFDPYINNLLIEAIRSKSKKIIIVNPDFGPQALKNLERDEYLRVVYNSDVSNKTLAGYIEDIQKNSFYSEMPEFNIKQINAESLDYIPFGTKEFLTKYFSNKGEIFVNLIKEYESKKERENPF